MKYRDVHRVSNFVWNCDECCVGGWCLLTEITTIKMQIAFTVCALFDNSCMICVFLVRDAKTRMFFKCLLCFGTHVMSVFD